jgi:hypothetical protein
MADARPLLERLLGTPDLARVVPQLRPDVLVRVIDRCGLEDCAELVALATPRQLARVLDEDLWRSPAPGVDETLDAERFGLWLDVLLQAGADVAARTIAALDADLVAAGLSRHVAVFDPVAVSEFTTLDGERMRHRTVRGERNAEVGGYVLEARRTSAWDAILELFEHLASDHGPCFGRVMRRCLRLSNAGHEIDGSYQLLGERDQQLFDLASEREARRARRGHVTPGEAQAFLQAAREVQLDAPLPPIDPLWRAHRRGLAAAGDAADTEQDEAREAAPADAGGEPGSPIDPGASAVMEVLRDAGVLGPHPRALLGDPGRNASRLDLVESHVDARAESAGELAFLANAVLAGCTIQGRPLSAREAADAAAAACNLGLECWPSHWARADLVTAFQVGWAVLHREVIVCAAEHLLSALRDIRCSDPGLQLQLFAFERLLDRHLRAGAPWLAQDSLDVILALDPLCWAALVAMIGSCPVLHAAVRAGHQPALRVDADRFEYIARLEQVDLVHRFLANLPSRLVE